ncbi:MAG: hypothetical protein ACK56F_26330, partial [bacterium]
MLRAANHAAYHPEANVFISHAWKYKFLDVVDALLHHFNDRPDIVVWFDLFSNNQHQATALTYDWWATTFYTAIAEFKYTVMVLSPWHDPIPLQRAWCLFELYCTHDTGCRFEVALGEKGHKDFVDAIDSSDKTSSEVVNGMLARIDVRNSEAFKPEDKRMIHDTVRARVPGGFNKLNALVLELMRAWVLGIATEEFKRRSDKYGEAHQN